MTDRANSPIPVVLGSWTRVLLEALNVNGYEGTAIAKQAGLEPDQFNDPNALFPISQTSAFWEAAIEATGDEALGLWVIDFAKPTSFHALGLANLASQNLLEALTRIARYAEVVSDVYEVIIEENGEFVHCRIGPRSSAFRASDAAMDAIFARIAKMANSIIDGEEPPLLLSLMRQRPANLTAYSEFFQCPILFNQPDNCITYSRELALRPSAMANRALAEQQDKIIEGFIESLRGDAVTAKMRKLVIRALPSGTPALCDVAREMGMSSRSLQRSLSERGHSYSGFLTDLRYGMAKHYLAKTELPVTEIAFLLGFANVSSLSRNFRTWAGQSPQQYRSEFNRN